MPQLMAEIEADMANVFTGLAVDDWRCMSMTIMAAGCKYLEVSSPSRTSSLILNSR